MFCFECLKEKFVYKVTKDFLLISKANLHNSEGLGVITIKNAAIMLYLPFYNCMIILRARNGYAYSQMSWLFEPKEECACNAHLLRLWVLYVHSI